MPVDVQHSIIMEFEEGQSAQPWFPPSGDPPPLPCHLQACSMQQQVASRFGPRGPGMHGHGRMAGRCPTRRRNREGPTTQGSYWRRWYLTRAARCRHVTDSRQGHDASSSTSAHRQKQQIEYFFLAVCAPRLPPCLPAILPRYSTPDRRCHVLETDFTSVANMV